MNSNYTTLGLLKRLSGLFMGLLLMFPLSMQAQEVTGLNDWTLYIDQGHSQQENMGLFNYSEAEKVLRVGLALRDMFEEQTDIEAVYVARETDEDFISLGGRVDEANSLAVDFYYSIHSDAGPSHINSTLMLYGGWKSNGVLVEKDPPGGGDYGEILDWDLTGAMRIERRGNYADRVFYQGDVYHHENQWPFLYVNRVTNMASLLSEAGFHTNPGQQMLNLNAEWKVLEALSAFRSFLEWHDIDRPAIGIATGIIKDIETGLAINDVMVTIGEQTYVTDGWESLFNQYSLNPDQLRNGFYWIEDLEPLSTVEVEFSREGYQTKVVELLIESDPNSLTEDNLSFLDPLLTSNMPATIVQVLPEDLSELVPGTPIVIKFSRKMNQESVEEAFSLEPEAPVSFSWNDDFTLLVNTSEFEYLQTYTFTIDGSIATNLLTGQQLDADGDGEEGGVFTQEVTMSDEDIYPPAIVEQYPLAETTVWEIRPIIRLVYDEEIVEESIGEDAITLHGANNEPVEGVFTHKVVDQQSILHFFPTQDLEPGTSYTATIAGGLSDMFNNETETVTIAFWVLDQPVTEKTTIDHFNDGVGQWWHPDQAGQTQGIVPELTSRTANAEVVVHSENSTSSMKLSYGWDMNFAGNPYIRQYLPPGAPQNANRFNIDDILQFYAFGDGSHNELRIVIRDGLGHLETHAWITIDWTGWKLISWDLANDEVFGWVNGNGELEGTNFYVDGFHLRYAEGAAHSGAIYFDHLHFINRDEVQYPTTLFENWQQYDDFTTNIFPWITIDVDEEITYNPAGFTFPGSGEAYAFKVMNPAETSPSIADDHPPVDGDKYLIAMMSQKTGEDKWLISPQLKATETSQLSFYAKSIQVEPFGPERIKVWVILDDGASFEFDPDSYILISEGEYIEVPDEWTQYSYYLGDYAGEVYRFAVQYVSEDDYMLMLDHFEVGEAITYALTLNAEPQEGGTVSGDGQYAQGQSIEVIATPAAGYSLEKWTDEQGATVSTDASYAFTMPGNDLSLTAHFVLAEYTLTLTANPEDAGTLTGAGSYFYQDEVTVTADPAPGYEFVDWSDRNGEVVSTNAQYTFYMPGVNYELFANFEEDEVGVVQTEASPLQVYPNPATEQLRLQHRENIYTVLLLDISGREVLKTRADAPQLLLDVSQLQTGFYLLRVETASGWEQKKIQIIQ